MDLSIHVYIHIHPPQRHFQEKKEKKRKHRVENSHGGGANGRPSSRLLKRNRFVCVIRQIVPETAYLYDAVHLYERSLLKALDEDRDPRNGRELVATLYGVHYRSAMGYVYRPFPPLPLCKSEKSTPKGTWRISGDFRRRRKRRRSVIRLLSSSGNLAVR